MNVSILLCEMLASVSVGKELVCDNEPNNDRDRYTVAEINEPPTSYMDFAS